MLGSFGTPHPVITHCLMSIPILNVFFVHSADIAGHLLLPMANHINPITVKHPAK
jgi:hypothetical protein